MIGANPKLHDTAMHCNALQICNFVTFVQIVETTTDDVMELGGTDGEPSMTIVFIV